MSYVLEVKRLQRWMNQTSISDETKRRMWRRLNDQRNPKYKEPFEYDW